MPDSAEYSVEAKGDSEGANVDVGLLIDRARADPRAVRGALLERYRNYLTLLARTRITPPLRAKASASDVVQETLLRAHRGFGRFMGETERELVAWLRRILVRRLVDLSRRYLGAAARDAFRERRLATALEETSDAVCALPAVTDTSPSQGAQRREMGVVLADALADLSVDHREVIVLRHLHGMSWAEVAAQMGRSRKAAGQLWARALEKLRASVEARL